MKNKLPTVVRSVRLDKRLSDQIEKLAERENRNFSNMVYTILKKYVNEVVE